MIVIVIIIIIMIVAIMIIIIVVIIIDVIVIGMIIVIVLIIVIMIMGALRAQVRGWRNPAERVPFEIAPLCVSRVCPYIEARDWFC